MKKKLFLWVISFSFVSFPFFAQTPPAPFAPQTVKSFADALFADGFFEEAESEYKRYLFVTATTDPAAILPLATLYNDQNNKDGALWLKQTFYADVTIPVKEKLNLLQGKLLFLERDASAFASFYAAIQDDVPQFSFSAQQLFAFSADMLNQHLSQAKERAQTAAQTEALFAPLADMAQAYKPKSAALAVFLSCVVPGLGKWYGGTIGGFVTDFLSVAGFAAGTIYTGIDSDWKSWRPYVFGTIGATLFAIDLYGSYKNIKRYNAAQYRKLCEETDSLYEKLF